MFVKFYYVYFLFQLTEMVDGIISDVATLTFRFEHEQSSGVPSGYLLEEIIILKSNLSSHRHLFKLFNPNCKTCFSL